MLKKREEVEALSAAFADMWSCRTTLLQDGVLDPPHDKPPNHAIHEICTMRMAEVEQQLQRTAHHTAPSDCLAKLSLLHQIDAKFASDYPKKSAYYKDTKCGLIEDAEERGDYSEDEDDVDVEEVEEGWEEPLSYDPVILGIGTSGRLQQQFMDIFNDVRSHFGLGTSRRALDREPADDEHDDILYPVIPELATLYVSRHVLTQHSRVAFEENALSIMVHRSGEGIEAWRPGSG